MPRPADTFSSQYDLATLQEIMNKGWRHVAALAKGLHQLAGLGEEWLGWRKSRDPKKTLCRAAENLFRSLLGIRFSSEFGRCVANELQKAHDFDQWHDNELRAWRALAEALVAGRTRHALVDFCSAHTADWDFPVGIVRMITNGQTAKPQPCTSEAHWSELLAEHDESEWNPHTIPLVELLLRAFDEPSLLEELYWRVVTDICLEEYIAELDALDKKLRSGECLTSEDQGVINEFTVYGSLMFRRLEENDGSFTVGRHFELAVDDLNRIEQEGVAIALLIPLAYDLGEKWVESQTWPRYEAICRAPSCGRCFYSGHRDAKNCPPANNGDACRLEWIRYKRWLEKQRLDAETTWADQTLQQQFSEQDEVRTEIRDEQISRAHGIGVR